jgi:hypothetical protein
MAVLIDQPMWPAHGTVWAHLVSVSNQDLVRRLQASGLRVSQRERRGIE